MIEPTRIGLLRGRCLASWWRVSALFDEGLAEG